MPALPSEPPTQYLQALIDGLCELSLKDPLTGLANRRYLYATLDREIDRVTRAGDSALLLMLDIDHFKQINDTFGHLHGDEVLCAVADAVRASIRTGDMALRYGGEEVLVILPSASDDGIREVARRINERIRTLDMGHPLTVSMGMAMGEAAANPREVFARADRAMYRAKAQGRDRAMADTD